MITQMVFLSATMVAGAADWSCLSPVQTSVDAQGRRTFSLDTPMGCWERKKQEQVAAETRAKKAEEEKTAAEIVAKAKAAEEAKKAAEAAVKAKEAEEARIREDERSKVKTELKAKAEELVRKGMAILAEICEVGGKKYNTIDGKSDACNEYRTLKAIESGTPPSAARDERPAVEAEGQDWTVQWGTMPTLAPSARFRERCKVYVGSVPPEEQDSLLRRIDPGAMNGSTMVPQINGECEVIYGQPLPGLIRIIEEPDGSIKPYRVLIVDTQYGRKWIFPPKGYRTSDAVPGVEVVKTAYAFRVVKLALQNPMTSDQPLRPMRGGYKTVEFQGSGPFLLDTISNNGLRLKTHVGSVDEQGTNGRWSDKLPLGLALYTTEEGFLTGPCYRISGPSRPWRTSGYATANGQNRLRDYTVPMCI